MNTNNQEVNKKQYVEYIANRNLKKLHGSDFEIASDEPDIRGWKVINVEQEIVGKVIDLLFDTASCKVRYIAIKLDGKPINLLSRNLLIPIGLVELDQKDDLVVLAGVTTGQLAALPDYIKGKVTIEMERDIRSVFSAPGEGNSFDNITRDDAETFYDNEHFDEERIYSARRKTESKNKRDKEIY